MHGGAITFCHIKNLNAFKKCEEVVVLDKVWVVRSKSAYAPEEMALFALQSRAKLYAWKLQQNYFEDYDDDDIIVLVFQMDIDVSC